MPAGSSTLQRLGERGAIARQILARQRAADAVEIGGDLAPDIAAIEIVEAGMGEVRQRFGKRRLLELGADFRRLAVDQKRRGKARQRFQVGELLSRQPRLAAA